MPDKCLLSLRLRLFYGCSYRFHLSGDNSRDRLLSKAKRMFSLISVSQGHPGFICEIIHTRVFPRD